MGLMNLAASRFAAPAPAPPPAPGGTLPDFTITSATGGTNLPWTFGHAFAEGDWPAGSDLTADAGEFQAVPTSYWPDGSVRHAIIAGRTTLSAGVATPLALSLGAPTGGADLTLSDLASALPTTTIAVSGTLTHTLTLGSIVASPHREVCVGPVMSNWLYRQAVAGSNHLVLWVDVRLYKGGTVEIFPWVENAYLTVASPTAISGCTFVVTVGGSEKFNAAITVPHHTRLPLLNNSAASFKHFSYWSGSDPQITPAHDVAYLRASKMVPNYGWTSPSASALNSLQQTYSPNTLAGVSDAMGVGGTSSAVLSKSSALYVTSGDARAWRAAMAFDLSGGSWSIHHRAEAGSTQGTAAPTTEANEPMRFGRYPTASIQVQDSPTIPEGTGSTNGTPVVSHQPSFGYLMWLCAGRWWFLEEMLFWAGWNYLWQTVSNRQSANGVMRTNVGANTDRGAAWALRTVAQLLATLPTTHPCYADIKASWEANMAWYAASNTAGNGGIGVNTLGVHGFYGDFATPTYTNANGGGSNYATHWYGAGFMQNMIHGVLGFAWDLSLTQSATSEGNHQTVRDFGYTMPVALAGDGVGGNWSYRQFCVFALNWGAVGGSYYGSWSGAYANYEAGFPSPAAGTSLLQHGPNRGSAMTGADSSNPYFGVAWTALVYAKDHGKVGAADGYARVTGASNFDAVASAYFHDDPVYGIVPRSA